MGSCQWMFFMFHGTTLIRPYWKSVHAKIWMRNPLLFWKCWILNGLFRAYTIWSSHSIYSYPLIFFFSFCLNLSFQLRCTFDRSENTHKTCSSFPEIYYDKDAKGANECAIIIRNVEAQHEGRYIDNFFLKDSISNHNNSVKRTGVLTPISPNPRLQSFRKFWGSNLLTVFWRIRYLSEWQAAISPIF